MSPLTRRTLIAGGIASAGVTVLAPTTANAISYPFTLGVASGEPAADGFVIWTRLAPSPLNADGLGGMTSASVTVEWQVSTDQRFTQIVRSGTATASQTWAHSVHVEVTAVELAIHDRVRHRLVARVPRVVVVEEQQAERRGLTEPPARHARDRLAGLHEDVLVRHRECEARIAEAARAGDVRRAGRRRRRSMACPTPR